MTNHEKKLYWTADSPYCRIVLWAILAAGEGLSPNAEKSAFPSLIHLSWEELQQGHAAELLGPEQTLPCLSNGTKPLSDSLRLLANLNQSFPFDAWLLSHDGALYRCAEGQLGRVMYQLYDGVTEQKIRPHWLAALGSIQKILRSFERRPEDPLIFPPWGLMATHTFLTFCLFLKPDWRRDLDSDAEKHFTHLELSETFLRLHDLIAQQRHRVPCRLFSHYFPTGV